jgi:hypothetical protein
MKLNKKNEKFDDITPTINKIESIDKWYNVRNDLILEQMSYPDFEENFKFDSMDKISNNIEKFFNTYLNLINTNRINQKLNQYLEIKEDLTNISIISMQSIFTKKNLDLNKFSSKVNTLINFIYFANSKYINENVLNLFALYNIIKLKLNDNNLFTYNLYNNYYLILVPKTMPEFIINEESLNEYIFSEEEIRLDNSGNIVGQSSRQIDRLLTTNIDTCYENENKSKVCKIGIKDLAGQELIKKFTPKTNSSNVLTSSINIDTIRDEIANNLDKIIKLCELYIVYDLILAYNDILPDDNNYQINLNNIKNTDKFKNLELDISNTFNSIQGYIKVNNNPILDINSIIRESYT